MLINFDEPNEEFLRLRNYTTVCNVRVIKSEASGGSLAPDATLSNEIGGSIIFDVPMSSIRH